MLLKDEFKVHIKDFYKNGRFVKSLNSTFGVLIPKKEKGADQSLYKWSAKVFANRLKKVIGWLITDPH